MTTTKPPARAPLRVGYMRVSLPSVPDRKGLTTAQYKAEYDRLEAEDFNRQRQALIEDGCLPEHIFSDRGLKLSHTMDRVGVQAWLDFLQPGDTAIITDQDRVSRTLEDQLALKREFEHFGCPKGCVGKAGCTGGVHFRMLGSNFDTSTPEGNMMFQVLGMVAEYMRRNTSRRTKAGLVSARAAGKHLGRPAALTKEQINHARALHADGQTPGAIARILGCSRSTVYRFAVWDQVPDSGT